MCTLSSEYPELKVAEAPIKVYKRIVAFPEENKCLSVCMDFEYIQGKIYESPLDPFARVSRFYGSGRGFYSYMHEHGSNAEFIIPKGAIYYLARDTYSGRMIYHSSQIIFNRFIKRFLEKG